MVSGSESERAAVALAGFCRMKIKDDDEIIDGNALKAILIARDIAPQPWDKMTHFDRR